MRAAVRLGIAAAGLVAATEVIDRRLRRVVPPHDGTTAVVVLGFPGHRALGRAIQRWRVEMAIRARDRTAASTVVFSGGFTRGPVSEAAEMAAIARHLGLPDELIVLEERAHTTWENVTFSAPLVAHADRVVLVSDGYHAARALRYWRLQFPDAHEHVIVDPIYRPLERAWIKLPSTVAQILRAVLWPLVLRRHRMPRSPA